MKRNFQLTTAPEERCHAEVLIFQNVTMLHHAELNISDEEALDVARVLRDTEIAVPASELLRREKNTRGILTFCGELDRILDNGVSLGQITEFCELRHFS